MNRIILILFQAQQNENKLIIFSLNQIRTNNEIPGQNPFLGGKMKRLFLR